MDQLVVDLDGDDPGAGAEVDDLRHRARTASPPPRTGPRHAGRSATRSSPGSGGGSPGATSTRRRTRQSTHMSRPPQDPRGRRRCRRPVAAAGAAIGIGRQSRAIGRRAGRRDAVREPALAADDDRRRRRRPARTSRSTSSTRTFGSRRSKLTLVFCHGYALNLDCWHFQRAAYRGLVRAVYYDQRSHGRSGRAPDGHATIEQLGHDLRTDPRPRRARGPGRPGRPLDGRHDDRRPRRAAPRAVRRPDRRRGPDLDDRRRPRPEPDPAADAARQARRPSSPIAPSGPWPAATARSTVPGGSAARWRVSSPTCSRSATRCRRPTSTSSTACCPGRRSRWSPSSSRASTG